MTYEPDAHQTKALETWYPTNHPLHFAARHPLLKLVGEIGEFIDFYAKVDYKPDFAWSREKALDELALDELGDIWYYCRILAYQKNENSTSEYGNSKVVNSDVLLAIMIFNSAKMLDEYLSIDDWLIKHLKIVIGMLKQFALIEYSCSLDELTDLNYRKLIGKDGKAIHDWPLATEY